MILDTHFEMNALDLLKFWKNLKFRTPCTALMSSNFWQYHAFSAWSLNFISPNFYFSELYYLLTQFFFFNYHLPQFNFFLINIWHKYNFSQLQFVLIFIFPKYRLAKFLLYRIAPWPKFYLRQPPSVIISTSPNRHATEI